MNPLAVLLANLEVAAEQHLRSGGAQTDEHFRMNKRQRGFEPGTTRRNLTGVGLLVDAAFTLEFPFKMLPCPFGARPVEATLGPGGCL